MELKYINSKKSLELADSVFFAIEFNEALVHQVVTAYMAAGRAGTKAQKTRSEVSGGGVKPFRQKVQARHVQVQSAARYGVKVEPLLQLNHVALSKNVNRKMYQGAIRSILSELIRQDRLVVVENNQKLMNPKQKQMLAKLEQLKLTAVF